MKHYIIRVLLICLMSISINAMTTISGKEWRDKYLNDEEKQWLIDNPTMTYGGANWRPVSMIKNNKFQGMLEDYMLLVAEKSGIKMEFITTPSWPDVVIRFKKGDIDIIPGVSGIDDIGILTDMIVSYPMVAVSGDDTISYIHSLESIKNKTFSVPKYWTSWKFIKKHLPNAKIIETDTLEEAILNVSQKKADIFIGHIAVASHSIATIAPSLRISGKLDFQFNHYITIAEKKKMFVGIVNKILKSIAEDKKMEIYSKWAHVEVKQNIDYIVVAQIIVVVIFIFLIIIFYTIKLNRVLKKTKEQQKSLNESIDYASTVQLALMSNNHSFDDYFSKSFTIWTPKDQVGGDIYLCRKVSNDEVLIYVIDCIGHGIPGALLTVYVKAIEQQVLYHFQNLNEPLNTVKILEFFHKKMLGLHSENINHQQALCFDGAVLYYNKKDKIIKFSGANTPIFYIQNNKIKEVKTSRRIIGVESKRDKAFTEISIKIDTDTSFYISTDGLMDQLGGEENLPLGKKKLKEKFLEIYKDDASKQKQAILKMFKSYQGSKDKIDDITLVSFKIEA